MTGRELVDFLSAHPLILLAVFVAPPVLVFVLRFVHDRRRGGESPWKYVYGALIYFVCMPGMFAAVLTGYSLFFTRQNLMDVNWLVYILPIVSMTLTLVLVARNVDLDDVPGFDRISGLMLMIGVSFAIVFAISRTSIWLFFGGSIAILLALCAGVFALLKWGAYMATRRSSEPRRERPKL